MALKILVDPPTIIPGTPEAPDYSGIPLSAVPYLQAAIDAGQYELLPDPEPPPPEPDWLGFKADYKSSPTIRAWFRGLDPMDREDLAAMVAAQSINGVAAAMADVEYSAVKSELNDLLALHNIGLTLP